MKTLRTFLGSAAITATLAAALLLGILSPGGAVLARAEAAPMPAASAPSADLTRAYAALDTLSRTYKYLDGVTLEMGTPPHGKQAVSFYTEGRIVISSNRTASVESIMMHEVWHIIDWRDNGRIDWAENVPPSNSQDYLRQ